MVLGEGIEPSNKQLSVAPLTVLRYLTFSHKTYIDQGFGCVKSLLLPFFKNLINECPCVLHMFHQHPVARIRLDVSFDPKNPIEGIIAIVKDDEIPDIITI